MSKHLELLASSRDDVLFVYRHLRERSAPEPRLADLASEALVEAGRQGKFWPLLRVLSDSYSFLERSDLERYAERAGLDLAAFRTSLDDRRHRAAVERDDAAFETTGLGREQPILFVNGFYFVGSMNYAELVERAEIGRLSGER